MSAEKILSNVEFDTNGGCWIWTGSITPSGYGYLNHNRAHRMSFEAFKHPIPNGLVIDHKCRVRCCVNPQHLRAVTPRVNVLENSESLSAKHAVATHCPQGHAYDAENTKVNYRKGRPQRTCRKCRRAANQEKGRTGPVQAYLLSGSSRSIILTARASIDAKNRAAKILGVAWGDVNCKRAPEFDPLKGIEQ